MPDTVQTCEKNFVPFIYAFFLPFEQENRLLREQVESASLEVFKTQLGTVQPAAALKP